MKKRFFATLMGTLIGATLILGGCGSSAKTADEAPLPKIEVAEVAETPAPETETDSASAEEVKEEVPEEVAEEVPEEVPEETPEEASETETTEEATEATEVEIVKDVPAEVQAAGNTATPVETAKTVATATIIDKYIADGDFSKEDHVAYGAEMGVPRVYEEAQNWGASFIYEDAGYYVAFGTSAQDATYAYVGIGHMNPDTITYCCLYDYTKADANNITVYSDGTCIPKQALYDLEATLNYMKSNPDTSNKPSISGMNWIGWDEW